MEISKVAIAVAVSTGFLFGCNTDPLDPPTEPPTSALSGEYWQISEAAVVQSGISAFASSDDQGLPNVYVFSADGQTQKFYTDDSTGGVVGSKYEIFETTYSESVSSDTAGTITFDLYNADGTVADADMTSSYSVTDGVLSLPDANTPLAAENKSDDQSVSDAVDDANDDTGVENAVQIRDTTPDPDGGYW